MNFSSSSKSKLNNYAQIAAITILIITAAEIFLIRDDHIRVITKDITFPIINLLSSIALLAAAIKSRMISKRLGLAWGFLFLAQLSRTIGDSIWMVLEVGFRQSPFPSIADVFYIAFYPLMLAGVLLLPVIRYSKREAINKLMDMGIVIIASILFFWSFILYPMKTTGQSEPFLNQVISVSYPLGDLLTLWALLLLLNSQIKVQRKLPLVLFAIGMGVMVITDTIYSSLTLINTFNNRGFLYIGWMAGILLTGLAGVAQATNEQPNQKEMIFSNITEPFGKFSSFFSYFWIPLVFFIIVWNLFTHSSINFLWLFVGAGCIISLVLIRQIITMIENKKLLDKLNHVLSIGRQQTEKLRVINEELTLEISERKLAEEKLAHQALYDSLTGLPNRILFMDRLSHAIEYAKRHPDYFFSVLFLDLDQFKVINDSLGHSIGDQLLIDVGQRLKLSLRSSDTIARLGGDEFVILLEDTFNDETAKIYIERIQETLRPGFYIQSHEMVTTFSAGVITKLSGDAIPEQILRDADTAMYRAKAMGKAQSVIFSPELRTLAVERLQLENELRHAIEREEFRLFYQPIYELEKEKIIGFEALIRWNHPKRGLIMPSDFINVAEESGLILEIDQWVLRRACSQMEIWHSTFPNYQDLVINVNISSKQFSQINFVDSVEQMLIETGLDPRCLKLEITERVVIENKTQAINVFSQLKLLGINLQVDDFGTGYSSLSYLQNFPIEGIKIDMSFIQEIDKPGKNTDLVKTILLMAHNLGMDAIAEGVETENQLLLLKGLSCSYAQGYVLSHPIDELSANCLLKSENSKASFSAIME